MSYSSTLFISLLLFMISLEKASSNHEKTSRDGIPTKVPAKRSFADLLDTLIKVNQERVTALKRLYLLNSITYGKKTLRPTIENELEVYDTMQEKLMEAVTNILSNLKRKPKSVIDKRDVDEVLHYTNELLVLKNKNDNNEKRDGDDEITNQQETNPVKKVLRSKDSDDGSGKETENDDSNSKDDSKSRSLEKQNEEALNEVKGNQTQGRSYYYSEYSCGRGRIRCIKACKEAYRYACDEYYCRSSLRDSLRSSCKYECKSWFY